jgi:hypothetical protein
MQVGGVGPLTRTMVSNPTARSNKANGTSVSDSSDQKRLCHRHLYHTVMTAMRCGLFPTTGVGKKDEITCIDTLKSTAQATSQSAPEN